LRFCFFAGREDFSAAQVRRTEENSPVRQHWEPRARPLAPERGVRIRARSHLSPRSGAGQLATWTQGSRPGLSSFALWALLEVRWLRLAALCRRSERIRKNGTPRPFACNTV